MVRSSHSTRTCPLLAGDSVTVNVISVVPEFPSATRGESIVSVGVSSSSMVPRPTSIPETTTTPDGVGALNCRSMVSSDSTVASPVTVTDTVWLVTPAAKVSVPAVTAV